MNLIPNTRELPCCHRVARIPADLAAGDVLERPCCGRRWIGRVRAACLPGYLRIDWATESESYERRYRTRQQMASRERRKGAML